MSCPAPFLRDNCKVATIDRQSSPPIFAAYQRVAARGAANAKVAGDWMSP
jgi:hypothetical protein